MARIVDTADDGFYPLPHPPRACAVTGRAEGRFVDFNILIDRPEPTHLYLDVGLIEEIAREHLGMVSAGKAKQLEEWFENAKRELEDLQGLLDAAVALEEKAGPGAVNRKGLRNAG